MKRFTGYSQNISAYLLTSLLILFGVLRLFTVSQSFNHFKNSILDMLIYKRNYSYDQKMQDLLGFKYTYIWHIAKNTPEDSVIYFPKLPYRGVEAHIARYFLYPRRVVINNFNPQNFPDGKVGRGTYVALIDDYPEFDISTEKVVVFDNGLGINDKTFSVNKYILADFRGKYGLIKINQ